MKRETVNRIRFVLEELVPPLLRDSALMRLLFRRYWGTFIDDLERFRTNIHRVTPAEYDDIYRRTPRIQEQTDNSEACVRRVGELALQGAVCDVGCGTGFLLSTLMSRSTAAHQTFTGVDFQIESGLSQRMPKAKFVEAPIENLPFDDRAFDTVICTHVLEHVLALGQAIAELRRVTRRRLIVIVPLEREYLFSFSAHINFFPYPHSFLRQIAPVPPTACVEVIGRDLLYWETREGVDR